MITQRSDGLCVHFSVRNVQRNQLSNFLHTRETSNLEQKKKSCIKTNKTLDSLLEADFFVVDEFTFLFANLQRDMIGMERLKRVERSNKKKRLRL